MIRIPHTSQPRKKASAPPKSNYGLAPEWQGPLAGDNSGWRKMRAEGRVGHALGKNPGDVWSLPTSSFRGGHHATFPKVLVEKPIKAGCPERICLSCNQPWRRQLPRTIGHLAVMGELQASCDCNSDWRPGLVLDPFMGSGTTAVVATTLKRDWLGIDINPDFAVMTMQRVKQHKTKQQGQPPLDQDQDQDQAAA